ncbi:MAG: class I SAM-dependent methyltransferase [Acidimicrobiia bacterium]
MPSMSTLERAVCQSAPWRVFAVRLVLPWALQGVEPRGDVLEIGGGSGAMAAQILEAFPDARVTSTDVDERMVADARVRLESFGDRALVRQASAIDLPFPDESFDMVLSFIMLHHVVEWESALTEALRVLRPGGVLVGYDLLSTLPLRALHRAEGQPFRMMTIEAFGAVLSELPLEQSTVRPGLARFAVRFRLTKQVATS